MERKHSVQRRLSHWRRSLSIGVNGGNHMNGDASMPPVNKTMFQGYEWYTLSNQDHWRRLTSALLYLRAIGIDTIWVPPGAKASSPKSNGYDVYDLYDLGEFDQKGSRATKWGSREDLLHLCETARREGIGIIWDAVLNHRAGADGTESTIAVKCNPKGMHLSNPPNPLYHG